MLFILPVGSENIEDHKPWAAYALVAVTVLAYFVGPSGTRAVTSWAADGSIGGYVLSMFAHADLFHLLGNMIFLLVFGGVLASRMSAPLFVGAYLVSGIVAAVVHVMASDVPAVGASGAINGLVGVYLVLFPLTRIGFGVFILVFQMKQFRVPGWLPILLWFVLDLYGASSGGGGTAYVAHLAGFACGVGIGLALLGFSWFHLHPEDLRTLPEIFGRSRRHALAPLKPTVAPSTRTSRPPASSTPTPSPTPTSVRVSRPGLDVTPRRDAHATVAVTKLACACGWSAEVPTIFLRDTNHCDRCRNPVELPA